jgi:hypothetical protein
MRTRVERREKGSGSAPPLPEALCDRVRVCAPWTISIIMWTKVRWGSGRRPRTSAGLGLSTEMGFIGVSTDLPASRLDGKHDN